jgi:predicted transcriptional regulator
VRLLTLIHSRGPASIYRVAKLSGRNHKNVYDDVRLLEKVGIVKTALVSIPLDTEQASEHMKDLDLYYDRDGRAVWRRTSGDGQQTSVWEPVAA